MTKNTIGGKGHKKSKNVNVIKNVPFKVDGCEYGRVKDLLGNGRLRVVTLIDNKERIGHIRGSMYKKIWIGKDDIVLVSLRDFQDNKCDIIHKYDGEDVKYLIKRGEIENTTEINQNNKNTQNLYETDIVFEEIEGEEIDIDNI